ncbi:Yip1 family protein [Alkalihalobacillus macyae]|uniref:Yip1 family protein n=1 Tax=Guptibacillus hwajinpoensis TaxID=208199 RepID=UPI00273C1A77|nr:Yip1 family protein [Alkalihalobacillus macyae]MDP4553412.1 Yip1 family protein [Alkalihalobacillus macyae]
MNEIHEETSKAGKPSVGGMIWSPVEQFANIRSNPKVWLPLIVITVLSIIGGLLTVLGTGFEEQFAATGGEGEDFEGIILFTKITTVVFSAIGPILGILISSFIFWLINKATSSEATFKQFFSMNSYIGFISAISIVLNGILIALLGGEPGKLYTSLGALVNSESSIGAFLNGIEIFGVWTIILTAIGLRVTARWPKGLAWTMAIIFLVFTIGAAAIGSMFNNMSGM